MKTVTCPHCLSSFDGSSVPDGTSVECPSCGKEFRVKADARPKSNMTCAPTRFYYTSDPLRPLIIWSLVSGLVLVISLVLIPIFRVVAVIMAILGSLVYIVSFIYLCILLGKKIDNIESCNSAILNELKKIAAR